MAAYGPPVGRSSYRSVTQITLLRFLGQAAFDRPRRPPAGAGGAQGLEGPQHPHRAGRAHDRGTARLRRRVQGGQTPAQRHWQHNLVVGRFELCGSPFCDCAAPQEVFLHAESRRTRRAASSGVCRLQAARHVDGLPQLVNGCCPPRPPRLRVTKAFARVRVVTCDCPGVHGAVVPTDCRDMRGRPRVLPCGTWECAVKSSASWFARLAERSSARG